MWGRALKIAETKMHARLAEVAATIGRRLQRLGHFEQAGELLMGAQDNKVTFLLLHLTDMLNPVSMHDPPKLIL